MSIAQIEKLRKERISKLEGLKAQLEKIENDDMYAPEYKLQKRNEIKKELEAVSFDYGTKIAELIDQTESKLLQGFHNAEYKGMDDKQAAKELLKEMRNRDMSEDLIARNKENPEHLYSEAEKIVNANLPYAPAYIRALKKLNVSGADMLEKNYKELNFNELQKSYNKEMELLREQIKLFEVEKTAEESPFKAALMDHYL
ncbi:hypothetical protein GCM10011409_20030 [Lentibacillus populi]|uniref:Uncharacterized protein n=1 Tax=Lentibacillus populi TaxID=1827502 RepID=A0A9W5TX44_9BACI|nr:hypothetical protein [Lentibacillus populi]GGB42450.1 hypothetical protein GCM10011409_20030 [Lentibacillus populi]